MNDTPARSARALLCILRENFPDEVRLLLDDLDEDVVAYITAIDRWRTTMVTVQTTRVHQVPVSHAAAESLADVESHAKMMVAQDRAPQRWLRETDESSSIGSV